MVYDTVLGGVVLIGTAATNPTASTWLYDGATWQRISTGTAPRLGGDLPVAWYDHEEKAVYLTGAADGTSVWSYSTMGWRRIADRPEGTVEGAAYDSSISAAVVLIDDGVSVQTWRVSGDSWSKYESAAVEAPLVPGGYHVIESDDGVLAIGVPESVPATRLLAFDGSHWHGVVASAAPGPRLDAAVVGNEKTGAIVMFGGRWGSPGAVYGDTWTNIGRSWQHSSGLSAARLRPC